MKRNKQNLIKQHVIKLFCAALLVVVAAFSFQTTVIAGEMEEYPELALLHATVNEIFEYDKEFAAELTVIVDTMQASLKAGYKQKASYSLKTFATLIFFTSEEYLPHQVRLDALGSVVSTQTQYDLPDEVEEHADQYCDNDWPHNAKCKDKKDSTCYTIKGKIGCT